MYRDVFKRSPLAVPYGLSKVVRFRHELRFWLSVNTQIRLPVELPHYLCIGEWTSYNVRLFLAKNELSNTSIRALTLAVLIVVIYNHLCLGRSSYGITVSGITEQLDLGCYIHHRRTA